MTASAQPDNTRASTGAAWQFRPIPAGRRTGEILALSALVVVMVLVAGWIWQHSSALTFQDDAAQTMSTAAHLVRGEGLKTSVLYYDSQLDQPAPARQTVWPAAVPALAAGLSGLTGLALEQSVIAILLAAHLLTAIALGAVARLVLVRPRSGRLLAVSVALGWTIYAPAMLNVTRGLSEPLFQLFAVLALLALTVAARHADRPAGRGERTPLAGYRLWLALASAAIAGAILSRYQAIALIGPLAAAAMLVTPAGESVRQRLTAGLIAALPASLVAIVLLGRNWLITGSLTGGAHSDRGQTLAEASARIGWLPESWQLTGLILLLGSALFSLILGMVLWARCFDTCRFRPPMFGRRLRAALVFCLLAYSGNIGLLAVLSLMSTVYVIELRYLTVNLLFLAIPAISAINCPSPRLITRPTGWHLSVGLPGLVAALAVLQFLAFQSTVEARLAEAQPAKINQLLAKHPFEGGSLLQWLQRAENRNLSLMTSHAHGLALVLNRKADVQHHLIGVPLPVYTNRPWAPGDIAALAQRHSVHYVLAFTKLPTWVYQDPVSRLASRPDHPQWLKPVVVTDELFLARVALPMISSRCLAQASDKVGGHTNPVCPRLIE